jgi:cold shock CspA family protein
MRGTVARVFSDAGFGFIEAGGQEFFFNQSALQGTDFGSLAPGVPLVFEVDQKPDGDRPDEHRRAVNIRLAEDAIPAVDNEILPRQKLA